MGIGPDRRGHLGLDQVLPQIHLLKGRVSGRVVSRAVVVVTGVPLEHREGQQQHAPRRQVKLRCHQDELL